MGNLTTIVDNWLYGRPVLSLKVQQDQKKTNSTSASSSTSKAQTKIKIDSPVTATLSTEATASDPTAVKADGGGLWDKAKELYSKATGAVKDTYKETTNFWGNVFSGLFGKIVQDTKKDIKSILDLDKQIQNAKNPQEKAALVQQQTAKLQAVKANQSQMVIAANKIGNTALAKRIENANTLEELYNVLNSDEVNKLPVAEQKHVGNLGAKRDKFLTELHKKNLNAAEEVLKKDPTNKAAQKIVKGIAADNKFAEKLGDKIIALAHGDADTISTVKATQQIQAAVTFQVAALDIKYNLGIASSNEADTVNTEANSAGAKAFDLVTSPFKGLWQLAQMWYQDLQDLRNTLSENRTKQDQLDAKVAEKRAAEHSNEQDVHQKKTAQKVYVTLSRINKNLKKLSWAPDAQTAKKLETQITFDIQKEAQLRQA